MKYLLIVVLSTISVFTNAQEADLKSYLTALKTTEFEESQKIIKALSFPGCKQYYISSYENISGITFETDAKNIKGYKAIFNCKLQNKAGTLIEKRMMIISYLDKTTKKWRIVDMREPLKSCDEFESAKKNIDVTRSQYSWRGVSYWALMCGKIFEAKEAVETSESRARAANDKDFINDYSDILKKIL